MTTTTEPAVGARTGPDTLRLRLWIGRNPGPFVLGCVVLGFLAGAAGRRPVP